MKKIIYYTLYRDRFGSRNYKVLGVTSEKSRQVFGRWMHNKEPTHVTKDKLVGKFETSEAAQAKIDRCKAVADKYDSLIEANNVEGTRLYNKREAAFKALIND